MTEISRYAQDRLVALYERIESIEHAVEAAGAILEAGIARQTTEIDAKIALAILHRAAQESFRGALLCSRDTTDAQLDEWIATS